MSGTMNKYHRFRPIRWWIEDHRFSSLMNFMIKEIQQNDNIIPGRFFVPEDMALFVKKMINIPEFIESINESIRGALPPLSYLEKLCEHTRENLTKDNFIIPISDNNIISIYNHMNIGGFTPKTPHLPSVEGMKSRLDELENVPEDVCQEAIGAIGVIIDDAKSPTPRIAKDVIGAATRSGAWVKRIGEDRAASLPARLPLPEEAPALWAKDKQKGDTPVTFIQRHYAPWLGKGLSRPDIRRLDPQLYMALANWLRGNPLPEGFDLPTKKQVTDSIAEKFGLTVRPTDDGPNQHAYSIARAADALRKRHLPK